MPRFAADCGPPRQDRTRTARRLRWPGALGTLLALALAACTALPAPPQPAPPPSLPLPPPPPPAPRLVAHASWSFQRGPNECRATARAGRISLAVIARGGHPIVLVLSPVGPLPHHRLTLRFAGAAGNWTVEAAATGGHAAVALFGPGDTGLSRLLIMLSGGTVIPEHPAADLPLISLPPSGADGAHWFGCVRNMSN
jgi:hypothetical protein